MCRQGRESGVEMLDYNGIAFKASYQDCIKVIEADVHYANVMAASIPRAKDGAYLKMKLVCNNLTPIFLFLHQWVDCSCTCMVSSYFNLFHTVVYKVCSDGRPHISSCRRKATIREFYSVILPSLQHLHDISQELDISQMVSQKKFEEKRKTSDIKLEREDECGICLEPCTKMVLPNCFHSMCIDCYHDWNRRSESCPFCRGSLNRVNSGDLWVLTCSQDVVDTQTVLKEEMFHFHLYINSLPKDIPDTLFLMYYEYLI